MAEKGERKMELQLAMDLFSLEDAVAMAQRLQADADIIEIGTPLLMREGIRAIRIMQVFRAALPHGKILTFFEDIIYTFLYGFALFTFCTGLTGAIRGFVLVGMLIGSVIEHLTVGNAVVSVLRSLFSIIRKLFAKTFSPVVKFITKRADGFRDCFVKKCKISSLRKKTSKST